MWDGACGREEGVPAAWGRFATLLPLPRLPPGEGNRDRPPSSPETNATGGGASGGGLIWKGEYCTPRRSDPGILQGRDFRLVLLQ